MIDVEALLARVPPTAASKGIILASVLDSVRRRPDLSAWTQARILAAAGGCKDMPGPFENVPYREFVPVLLFVARLLRGAALGEGLRELGRQVYPNFAGTLIGRMLFGALRHDPARVMMMGPSGWRVCENFGSVEAERLGPQHVRYVFEVHPIELIETMYLGTIEGAAEVLGISLDIGVATAEPRTLIDLRWR